MACKQARKAEISINAVKRDKLKLNRWMLLKNPVFWTEYKAYKWDLMALVRWRSGRAYIWDYYSKVARNRRTTVSQEKFSITGALWRRWET